MRRTDRVLLAVSYVLLVGVVAFLSWDIDRQVKVNQRVACDVVTATALLVYASNQDRFDEEALSAFDALFEGLEDPCGTLTTPLDVLRE